MSLEAEQGVLYGVLVNNACMQECDLEPYEFSRWQHQEIFAVVQELVGAGDVADVVTVCERLERRVPGQQLLPYLNTILSEGVCPAGIRAYSEIVRSAHRKAQALAIAEELRKGLLDGGGADPVDVAIRQLMALNALGRNYDRDMSRVMAAGQRMIDQVVEADGLVGISTGLADLDDSLGGFHKTDLVVIGARPAMGKTALLLNLALAANAPVGIISAEQGHEQMGLRLISVDGKLDSQKIRTGNLDDSDWLALGRTIDRLSEKPIRLNDEPGICISKVVQQARDWKFKYGIKALYVDYLQKIRTSDRQQKRYEQVGEVAGCLKNLARELDIPVIALAQVNRECERRPNKRPLNSDLADASEIEKEADEILFLYRDELYHPDTPDQGIAEIDISKNRHGPVGTVRVAFRGQFMRFEQLQPPRYDELYGGAA